MKIFHEKHISELFKQIELSSKSEVEGERDDYILKVDEDEHVNHLFAEYEIKKLNLKFDDIYQTNSEQWISPGREQFFNYESSKIKRPVVTLHLPFEGDPQLLRCSPTPSNLIWTIETDIGDGEITFSVVAYDDDPERIKREIEGILKNLKQQLDYQGVGIDQFNSTLKNLISDQFKARKKEVSSKVNIFSSIGIPLKKATDLPPTFAVPIAKVVKKLDIKPQVSQDPAKPSEPTLADEIYQFILEIIDESGQIIEKHPSLYKDRDEEGLRDYLLFQLQPRIIGSVSGETFNKSGKTDILIQYEGKNVFVAECQFWGGQQSYLDKITQLLGYLTWRDSKVALVIFVKNSNITNVLKEIEDHTPDHPNYSEFKSKKHESWLNYEFNLNGDKDRKLKLSILVIHTPD